MGGELRIGMILFAEALPSNKRAQVLSYVGLGWQSGVLLAAILPPLLLPLIGWKGMFLVGIILAIITITLRSKLHVPKLFVSKRNELQNKRKVSLKLLLSDVTTTKNTIGIIILTTVQNFGYYGLMIWLPTFMAKQLGFSLAKSLFGLLSQLLVWVLGSGYSVNCLTILNVGHVLFSTSSE